MNPFFKKKVKEAENALERYWNDDVIDVDSANAIANHLSRILFIVEEQQRTIERLTEEEV